MSLPGVRFPSLWCPQWWSSDSNLSSDSICLDPKPGVTTTQGAASQRPTWLSRSQGAGTALIPPCPLGEGHAFCCPQPLLDSAWPCQTAGSCHRALNLSTLHKALALSINISTSVRYDVAAFSMTGKYSIYVSVAFLQQQWCTQGCGGRPLPFSTQPSGSGIS